jgi:hypothetical protein
MCVVLYYVMLFYVLYVIFCWILLYYNLSIVPNLKSKSLVSSYSDSTVRFVISYLRFLAVSAIHILNSTPQQHPPSNSSIRS